MLGLAIRQCTVLILGVIVSCLASLFGNAGRDFGALAAAIVLPIAFCLIRAAFVQYPAAGSTNLQHVGFQTTLGLALVSLLLFEISVALFVGAADIPIGVWIIVAAFGLSYILLFGIAHSIGGLDRSPNDVLDH